METESTPEKQVTMYLPLLTQVVNAIPYHGCNIYPINNKFKALGKVFDSLEEAKQHVDKPIVLKNLWK